MKQITTVGAMRDTVKAWKKEGLTVGLVPTMGFLHAGHVSLMNRARLENDRAVVSIFVNPIQFGPNEDFDQYPRDIMGDLRTCEKAGMDAVFAPGVCEMYPSPNKAYVDITELSDTLCGASRSGHFRGVCTVVTKLICIVSPDRAYFGEKDAQQLAIIKRMAEDLNLPVSIVPCPIIREESGLALSSRNAYLSAAEKKAAPVLNFTLAAAKELLEKGETDADTVRRFIRSGIKKEVLARIDYVDVVDHETLKPVTTVEAPVLAAVAVYFGKTRLIDNFTFYPSK